MGFTYGASPHLTTPPVEIMRRGFNWKPLFSLRVAKIIKVSTKTGSRS